MSVQVEEIQKKKKNAADKDLTGGEKKSGTHLEETNDSIIADNVGARMRVCASTRARMRVSVCGCRQRWLRTYSTGNRVFLCTSLSIDATSEANSEYWGEI